MPAEWAVEAMDAVRRRTGARPDPEPPTSRFTRLGTAVPAPDRGWWEIAAPGVVAGEWWFAGVDGPDAIGAFLVDEVRRGAGDRVLLRAPAGLPADLRDVWADVARPVRLVPDVLAAAGSAPLAVALADGRLDGAVDLGVHRPSGLSPEQAEAYRACRTPGLRLVWGPPGPRTTGVLAVAAADLAREGRRVLLLAATDTGVDAAAAAVTAELETAAPGLVVRVGPATAPVDGIELDLLAARETVPDDRRRAVIGHQLGTFAGQDPEIAALTTLLEGYDDEAYQRAARRVAAAREAAELEPRRRAAAAVVRTAATRHTLAVAVRAAARRAIEAAAGARAALDRVDARTDELRALDRELSRNRTGRDAARTWATRGADGWFDRRRRHREARAADRELARVEQEIGPRRAAAHWDLMRARAAAGRITRSDLAELDSRLADAHAAVLSAATDLVRAEAYAEELSGLTDAAMTRGAATDADRELVEAAVRAGSPARYERLLRLRRRRPTAVVALSRLAGEHHALAVRAAHRRAEARAELVSAATVVATTVTTAVALPLGRFDVVLVDGAAAVSLAEAVAVVSLASTTAVLCGDFQRPGPRLTGAERALAITEPATARWVAGTAFARCGITSAEAAIDADGCIAMLHELRGHARIDLPRPRHARH